MGVVRGAEAEGGAGQGAGELPFYEGQWVEDCWSTFGWCRSGL